MPYLVLLSTITFDIVYSATTISRIAILNFYTRAVPRLLSPNLSAVATFFNGWSYAITFAALVAFLWGRESAFLSPSRGKSGRRNKVVNALNFVMIVALLGLGTAVSAISMSLQRGFATGALSPTRDRFEIAHRRTVIKWLQYAFRAVTLLSTANVFVTALLLFMSAKRKGLTDQVRAAPRLSLPDADMRKRIDNQCHPLRGHACLFDTQHPAYGIPCPRTIGNRRHSANRSR
jgi:hypothetical protein